MASDKNPLLDKIKNILRQDPARMYSREEILNVLAPSKQDADVERLLAELEVSSSATEEKRSDVYATCRGGTVYYKWNKAS
jgi:hypothetical protein